MGNRGQKRAEVPDELPADKRACSSLEYRPSSSNLSVQTPINSTYSGQEARHGDMDTSSSASGSTRSEGDAEKDSAYGSCDSDEMADIDLREHSLREYQRRRSSGDHGKFKKVLSSLSEEVEQSGQLVALTELCELLSFSTDSSLSSTMADSFAPIIVRLARHESNPEIMLLAVRAITYLCDIHPRSSAFLVRHNAVPALCERLMAIEYLDVAEQCLQALQKISLEQPHVCLESGAIMAVLNYIDFFSTSVQRVALSTVVNICKTLPPECPPSLMEAVPILCNLLQYEDRQLVENVATCLISIAERVRHSSDKLDELCKHGLIHQVTHLIDLNSRTTLCQPVYTGLIWLLAKLASGSLIALTTLFELNISSILKDILSNYDLLHGMPSSPTANGHSNQVHEVLKLLCELLPPIRKDQDVNSSSNKEALLMNRPDLLQIFGMDLLPVLIQVVNSGVNLYVCYGCLSVINKLVYLSKSDMLLELLKTTNMSSFLAGVFTRKDQHVLVLTLQIVDTILQKLPEVFSSSFIKEGVFFAIDALLMPETGSQSMFPMFNNLQLSNDLQKSSSRDLPACLCYTFDSSTSTMCKLEKDSVHSLAERIKANYISSGLLNREKGLTDILQKLKTLSAALTDLVNTSMNDDASSHEEEFYCILRQIMLEINGRDPISTFEFIESGIVKSLGNYLSNGQCLEKRFEVFGRLFSSSSEDFAMSALIGKLQSALSSVENFPIILGNGSKQKNSYATVPCGRCTTYPCLKVQFLRGEEETGLSDYCDAVLTVDLFSSMDAIETYLWPKVSSTKRIKCVKPDTPSEKESSSPQCKSPDLKEADSTSSDLHEMQEDKVNLSPREVSNFVHKACESSCSSEGRTDLVEQEQNSECPKSCNSIEVASPKLSFYLDGQELDRKLTLYQSILQRQAKSEHEIVSISKLWSQVYKIIYRKGVKHCNHQMNNPLASSSSYCDYTPFFSGMFASELVSDLEKSSPTYTILFLLKSLEAMNSFRFHLSSRERIHAFAKGRVDDLDKLKIFVSKVVQNEFVNNKLNEKLEQQMRDPLSISIGGMPSWCSQLVDSCPFLFSFETRSKYFKLAAFGQPQSQPSQSNSNGQLQNNSTLPRKKFLVYRDRILESAAQMMDLHARKKTVLEVEYDGEVGTGLGPTLEFYTLVGYEFQKLGLGLWREEHTLFIEENGIGAYPFGLFPRPWSSSSGIAFEGVIKKFFLLGQVVAKALQDGRVLDLPFSKAFYRVILGKDLSVYDIQSFDPGLGRALLEFQALVERKRYIESVNGTFKLQSTFQTMKIEDLCLDFSLPGYPDYILSSGSDLDMVNMSSLEEYVSLVVDATINSGISRQVDAFKSGFNQVFPVRHLQIFNEEELERLLCGERELWNSNDLLDHIKFDHGYTASSPPIVNLLEIIREFAREQQKAFLQFVTGAPRLPTGGLASLNPKLTIVRKHCGRWVDSDLPSVMTCANYLKLPPYSSKEKMKEKLLYAITEGQGSFHLS